MILGPFLSAHFERLNDLTYTILFWSVFAICSRNFENLESPCAIKMVGNFPVTRMSVPNYFHELLYELKEQVIFNDIYMLFYIRKENFNPATTTTTPMYVTLRVPALDSETGWTGERGD